MLMVFFRDVRWSPTAKEWWRLHFAWSSKKVVQVWPGCFSFGNVFCTRMTRRSHSFTHTLTHRTVALQAVQDGVTPSFRMQTALCHPFRGKQNFTSADVLDRLNAQYGKQTLSRVCVYDWGNKFSVGREQVANRPRAYVQPTDVANVTVVASQN